MRLLEALAAIFFDTFGITKPTDATRRRAAWFLLAMVCGVAAALVVASLMLYHVLHV